MAGIYGGRGVKEVPRTFETKFVYQFKRGDNIALNVKSLSKLWELRERLPFHERWMLNKPIVVLIASVAEACLCELFHQIRHLTIEGVPYLSLKQIRGVRKTKKDEFAFYKRTSKQNSLLGNCDETGIYKQLEALRNLRNRIHIQNLNDQKPRCEKRTFDDLCVLRSEQTLEEIFVILSEKYSRKVAYTPKVTLPWDHKITL